MSALTSKLKALSKKSLEKGNWQVVTAIPALLAGSGSGSYYLRAKLPYGSWRITEDIFELKEDWLEPKEQTFLADYPYTI